MIFTSRRSSLGSCSRKSRVLRTRAGMGFIIRKELGMLGVVAWKQGNMSGACRCIAAVMLACCRVAFAGPAATQPSPQIHLHAHNDYLHERPLSDALEHGFCSVEADVHLVAGKLLVAHEIEAVKADRTLQSLYLDP